MAEKKAWGKRGKEPLTPRAIVPNPGTSSSRTPRTEAVYSKHGRKLVLQFRNETGVDVGTKRQFVEWYRSKDNCWSRSTIGTYRQYVKWFILRYVDDDAEVDALIASIECSPKPKARVRKKRKAYDLCPKDWDSFKDAVVGSDDEFAMMFLNALLIVISRPVELGTAFIVGDELFIRNAKSTNGRGGGFTLTDEELKLAPAPLKEVAGDRWRSFMLSEQQRSFFSDFLPRLRARSENAGSWDKFYRAMTERIRRISKRAGLKEAISPYKFRHIALACAKREWQDRQASGAAGHKDTLSAGSYYKRPSRSAVELAGETLAEPTNRTIEATETNAKANRFPTPASLHGEGPSFHGQFEDLQELTPGIDVEVGEGIPSVIQMAIDERLIDPSWSFEQKSPDQLNRELEEAEAVARAEVDLLAQRARTEEGIDAILARMKSREELGNAVDRDPRNSGPKPI